MDDVNAQIGQRGSRTREFKRYLIAAVLLAAVAAVVVWRLSLLGQQAQQRPRGRFGGATQPVGVSTVGTHDIRVVLDELGTVTPLATITVQTQISGLLMQLGFQEGQIVKQGQLIAQIDPRPYQAALDQYEGQLVRDQAALKEAQMDLQRYDDLVKHDAVARQTEEDQRWVVAQDVGTVKLDQAQVDAQKLNLVYCHIATPVTGRVGIRLVDPGNYIETGSTTGIVVVTQLDPISVLFTVPEDVVQTVLQQAHDGKLPVVAYDRANVKELASGTLSAVDTQVDTTTGTVKLRAMFQNANNALFPQQFVNVRLLVNTLHDVVAVPQTAVQTGSTGSFVYLLTDGDIVKVRPVQLGPQDGDLIAVEGGLGVGDRVVTDGTDQLRDGTHVTIMDTAAHARRAAPSSAPGRKRRPGAHRPPDGTSSAPPV
jgi:membrane fusion protein, multidrug efflux system